MTLLAFQPQIEASTNFLLLLVCCDPLAASIPAAVSVSVPVLRHPWCCVCAPAPAPARCYVSVHHQVIVSGKLRAQRAKSMKFKDGYMVSSGDPTRLYIDGAVRHVMLRQGVLGIKVGRQGCDVSDVQ